MIRRHFYLEFDPRRYTGVCEVIMQANSLCMQQHGQYFEEYDLEVGKLPANAELHFFKAVIWLDADHSNDKYLI